MPDADELLSLAIDIVHSAADMARRMRSVAIGKVSTKSTDTDVVTAADHAVEQQVIKAIQAIRPMDSILGEEFGSSPSADRSGDMGRGDMNTVINTVGHESCVRWILDPIDGTVNYLYGIPHYAVSLAAEVRGEVVAGVVHNIETGQEWTATRGGGSYTGGRRLSGSPQNSLGHALIATGFAYDAARRAHQARVLMDVLPKVRDIRRLGAASLDLCMAAEGRVDAYYEKGLQPWDLAAGGLIAREAGLLVTGAAGAEPGPDLVIAAPPALHSALDGLLTVAGADKGH